MGTFTKEEFTAGGPTPFVIKNFEKKDAFASIMKDVDVVGTSVQSVGDGEREGGRMPRGVGFSAPRGGANRSSVFRFSLLECFYCHSIDR